jgi:hypothetical protein
MNAWQANIVAGVLQAGTSTGNVTFAIAGNSVSPAIIGSAFAGQALELERAIFPGGTRSPLRFTALPDPGQLGNIRPYPRYKQARRFRGNTILTQTGLDAFWAWFSATDDGYLPSVVVPDANLNDAWTVVFEGEPQWRKHGWGYEVTFGLIEYPRRKWI